MNALPKLLGRLPGLLAILLLTPVSALPQTAPAQTPPIPPSSTTDSVNEGQSKPDQPIVLSPYEVRENKQDIGYSALNSNSITGFNTSLEKLPLSAKSLMSSS